ncbi:MAG: sulfatase-like hydrolase/transferase [SAR202 cluster bacterium]|nr:sulfatase-like hydrolase/transferase [SAR202 cluster bacterium]
MNQQSRPNIVLILMDNLGSNDIGPYGAEDIRTPNLDRLAHEGVRLTQCYSNAPVCTPSRAALWTGLYPARAGLESNVQRDEPEKGLSPSQITIAQMLKDNGYATAIFGKWHLGFKPEHGPNAHGFDQFFGFLDWTIDYHSHKNVGGYPALYENTELVEQDGYFTDLVTDHAVSFIDQHADEPFFTFVSYNAPLPPYQRPDRPDDVRTAQTWFDMDRQNYASSIERADEGIGRILAALDANSLSGNTVVIFASDHGGDSEISSNRPLFHGFGTLWEGGIRVPCIIRWPGHLPAGADSSQPTIMTDLSASILSSTGTNPPEIRELDGINIFPMLNGTDPDAQRTFFWRIDFDGRQQAAVRQGKWKYMLDGGALPRAATLLFNLEEDVSERQNLAHQYPEVLHDLQRGLARWEDDIQR